MKPKITDRATPVMNGIEFEALVELLNILHDTDALPYELQRWHAHILAVAELYPRKPYLVSSTQPESTL
jgi:hypothetical protein